jgi:formate dehydrogenase maturation protein FdhE
LSRPTLKEQIHEIESAAEKFPEHLDLLNLRKAILKILATVDESPTKGAISIISDETLNDLKEKAVASKKPMSSFIDPSIFKRDMVWSAAKEIAEYLVSNHPQGEPLQRFLEALEGRLFDAGEAVRAILNEDAEWFQRLGDSFGVEPSLLLFLLEAPLQPFFEDLARRVEGELKETWWEPYCPVCGRASLVARIRQRKRYMTCTFCGAEHLVDLFLCVNCGNNEPYSLGFLTFKEHPEYELNYCEKCNHYIKVIHEDRLKRKIPKGLEDLLTRDLDMLAEEPELNLRRA